MSTIEDKPPFEFGQVVYVVEGSAHGTVDVPCPICFGKLFVKLILGNGEEQPIECEACGKGCNGPQGVITAWKPWSHVHAATVTGLNHDGGRWRVSVSGHHSSEHIFADEETAEVFRQSYHQELEEHARRMQEQNMMRHKKQHSWSARYHREHIARLQQEMSYHEGKLMQKRKATVTRAGGKGET